MTMTADQIDDFDAGFDDGEEGGLSGFYVLAIFLAIVAAFLVIVWFAYQKGLATGAEGSLPVVAADPRPVREEVPVALGTENPRERVVYDRTRGVSPTSVIAEANPAADPMEGFDTRTGARTGTNATNTGTGTGTGTGASTGTDRNAGVGGASARDDRAAAPNRASTPAPQAPAATARTEAVKPAQPTAQAQAPAPATTTVRTAAPGTHVVQVGAFGSDEEALRFFATLSGKHGAFVGDKSPDVQRADVKGKTYHRLRLAPFASKAAAQDYCTELKGKGQDCLVRPVS